MKIFLLENLAVYGKHITQKYLDVCNNYYGNNLYRLRHYLGMWRDDKFHGAGILLEGNSEFYSGMFREGEKSSESPLVLEQDDKWTPLFEWCAELLEQMVCHFVGVKYTCVTL